MALANKKIVIVGGARPNFMKIAPLALELKKHKARVSIVNAGQHYDSMMNEDFFKEFGISADVTLKPSRDSVTQQFADMLSGLGTAFETIKPDLVIVVGDVNATLAAALTAHMQHIPLAHVEAGLRSFNKAMSEEWNRLVTDQLSDILFVTEESGLKNLKREKLDARAHFVGNIMLDTLAMFLPKIKGKDERYYFCTLHRPQNVDDPKVLKGILDALEVISHDAPIYLPLHPRTARRSEEFGLQARFKKIFRLLPPLSYTETIQYQKSAGLVLTDSGGIQEETTFLGVPCLTLRDETERPVTVKQGTNIIGGTKEKTILAAYKKYGTKRKRVRPIQYWDGKTAARIARVLNKTL